MNLPSWIVHVRRFTPNSPFTASAMPRAGSSLLLHFANQPGAIRLGRKPNDEVLQRSLRNLDRVINREDNFIGDSLLISLFQDLWNRISCCWSSICGDVSRNRSANSCECLWF